MPYPDDDDTIIISGYKRKVMLYGIGPFPAWVLLVAPVAAFLLGLLF